MKIRWLAIFNTLSLALALVLNGLAVYLPLNGISTAEVSRKFANLFVPANYTFGIWSLIYLLLILFAIYQLKLAFGKKSADQEVINKIGPWFVISSIFNALWIVAWHNLRPGLALVLMAGILLTLIAIYINLRYDNAKYNRATRWLVLVPISVYLGWISVATIANVAALLTSIRWSGWGLLPNLWAVIMLVVGLILAVAMIWKYSDYAYALVIVWAYIGIFVARVQDASSLAYSVVVTSMMAVAAILVAIGLKVRENLK